MTAQRLRSFAAALMRGAGALWLAAWLAGCVGAPATSNAPTVPLPEAASGYHAKSVQAARHFMVSAAHPLARRSMPQWRCRWC
jgi:hypothetical protein